MARTSIVVTHNSSMKKHHIYQIHTELHNYNYRYTTGTSILCGNIKLPKLPKLPTYIYIFLVRSTKKWQSGGCWARPALLASTSWFEWKHGITFEKHHGWS